MPALPGNITKTRPMRFIKLTYVHGGEIHVKPEAVTAFQRKTGVTNIQVEGTILSVTETPEQILAMIEGEVESRPADPTPLVLQEGKRYVRRDGLVTSAMSYEREGLQGRFRADGYGWHFSGSFYKPVEPNPPHPLDLISEYVEGEAR